MACPEPVWKTGDVLEGSCGLGESTNWELYRKILTKNLQSLQTYKNCGDRWGFLCPNFVLKFRQCLTQEVRHWLLSITLSKINKCRQRNLDVYSSSIYAFKPPQTASCDCSTKLPSASHPAKSVSFLSSVVTAKSDVWLYID